MPFDNITTFGQLDQWISEHEAIANRSEFARIIGKPYQTVVSWFKRPDQEIPEEIVLLIKSKVETMSIEVVTLISKVKGQLDTYLTNEARVTRQGVKYMAIGDLKNGKLLWQDQEFGAAENAALLGEIRKEYVADRYAKEVFAEIFSREKPVFGKGKCTLFSYKKWSVFVEPLDADSETIIMALTDVPDFQFNALQLAVDTIKVWLQGQSSAVKIVRGSIHV